MKTKKKKKTKAKAKTKTIKRVARTALIKPAPKTLFAAIDPMGSLRFSSADEGSIDAFVGKLSKFYRVERYDLRIASVAKKRRA